MGTMGVQTMGVGTMDCGDHGSTDHESRVACFVLFSLQLSVCLWWHDYRKDGFPALKFVVVIADLLTIC